MSLLGDMKDALSVVDKAANYDLYIRLVGLTDRIIELSDERNALKEKNDLLTQVLHLQAEAIYEHPYYFFGGMQYRAVQTAGRLAVSRHILRSTEVAG